jgi:VNT family MFS transporter (synaptic vesicle glycoprotein 2)
MAVTLAVARIGAILGNVVFGYFIEISCAVPILMVAVLLVSGGLLSIKLPNTSNTPLL